MVNSLWPVNAVSGSPSYNGRMLRQVGSVRYAGARSGRPFGTRSGVRPGTPETFVGASSTTWWVDPHAGVLDVHTPAQVGPYEYAIDTTVSGGLTAADASNPRVDIVWVQVADASEGDGTTTPGVVVGYTAGVPDPSPSAPAAPARAMVLGTIAVPKAGGGSPTTTRQAPTLTLAGTPYQVRSDAERDALLSVLGSSVAAPLWVEHVGGARAGVVERHRGGAGWLVVVGETSYAAPAAEGWSLFYSELQVTGRRAMWNFRYTATPAVSSDVAFATIPAPARASLDVITACAALSSVGWRPAALAISPGSGVATALLGGLAGVTAVSGSISWPATAAAS